MDKKIKEVEKYIKQAMDILQFPFGLNLCIDNNREKYRKKLEVGNCEAALKLYTLDEPILFISKNVVLKFCSESEIEKFQAEKTICHELVHGLMKNTLEIAFDYIKESQSFEINLERDTDIIAERIANMIRIVNRGFSHV